MKNILTIISAIFVSTIAFSQNITRLSNIYSDGGVLKQNSEVSIRGWANPANNVRVVASWNDKDTIVVKTANSGQFVVKIKTPAASFDKHSISFDGKELMKNVYIGEVWLCSGQSNMQWSINHGIKDGQKIANEANDEFIRIFHVPMVSAEYEQNDVVANWESANKESVSQVSAIAYLFARKLKEELKMPIGIVESAWGGASIESFMPKYIFDQDTVLKNNANSAPNQWLDDRPTVLYNGMIAPLKPYAFSGVLWYQGEANITNNHVYDQMSIEMIDAWRDDFGENTPFYFAMIAPFNYAKNTNLNSALLRKAQRTVAKTVDNCELIVLSDLVENVNNIHPTDKLTPALRFANIALTNVYGFKGLAWKFPFMKSCVIDKTKAVVTFDNLVGDLRVGDGKSKQNIVGLVIVDSKGGVHNANGKVEGRNLVVTSKGVKDVVEVRYEFDDTTIGNLFSSEGLPVAPFSSKFDN